MNQSTSRLAPTQIADGQNAVADVFRRIVRSRHSVRSFLPDPVPEETLRAVLNDAQLAPSNSNTQPWHVHIVSGNTRDALANAMLDAVKSGRFSPDFPYSTTAYTGVYGKRCQQQGEAHHSSLGIARDDAQARMAAALDNYRFFNAPHAALLFMPSAGETVRVAGDLGIYSQTFLLSLVAHGLAGIPQTSVSMVADTVREVLGVDNSFKLLLAISFGYATPDQWDKPAMGRAAIEESVTFHE